MTDKNLLVITPHRKEPGKQRIAAYCRVSSRSDEQLNSLENQIDFYRVQLSAYAQNARQGRCKHKRKAVIHLSVRHKNHSIIAPKTQV